MRVKWTLEPTQVLKDFRSVAAKVEETPPEELLPGEKIAMELRRKDVSAFFMKWHELERAYMKKQTALIQADTASVKLEAAMIEEVTTRVRCKIRNGSLCTKHLRQIAARLRLVM